MSDKLPALLSGVVADTITGFASGGASTGGAVAGILLSKLFEKRLGTARDILTEQLGLSDKTLNDVADLEEAVAITFRYARAAQEGAARLNLRLMAKVIAGQAHLGNLVADDFLYYADLMASLRRDEIVLIATLHKHRKTLGPMANENEVWEKTSLELTPSLFKDDQLMQAVATGTMRTGLTEISGEDWKTERQWFTTTAFMDLMDALAPFADVLREEGIVTETGLYAEY